MIYPATPTNARQAKAHAEWLSKLHNKNWIAIERIRPLKSKLIPDFAAIEASEPMILGWREIV